MDYLKLTDDHLNVNDIFSLVASPKCGANSIFVGTTRDNFEGKKVVHLEYQAYEEMALKVMRQVCQEIRESEDVEHLAIYHRLGVVPVGEASVVIAASSPHKMAAANAVNTTIKALKGKVPIWKKEIYADGQGTWKENKECKWGEGGEPSQR